MKTYKNITNVEQLDIPPGETGERDIPPDQEERMVERGAIEVVSEAAKPEPEAQKTPEEIEAEENAAKEAAEREQAEREERERQEAQRRGRGRS